MYLELSLLALTLLIYRFIYSPWRLLNWYCKVFESLGYRVHKHPYSITGGARFIQLKANFQKYGDSLYHQKHFLYNYDLSIANVFNQVAVWFINPDIIKQFYAPENLSNFPKLLNHRAAFHTIIGKGLLYSEGTKWKNKRKLMTQLFDFNFIKSKIPQIIQVVNFNLDSIQKSQYFPKVQISHHLTNIFGSITTRLFFGYSVDKYKIEGQSLPNFLSKLFASVFNLITKPESVLFGFTAIRFGHRKIFREFNKKQRQYREKLKEMVMQKIDEVSKMSSEQRKLFSHKDLITGIFVYNEKCQNPEDRYSDDDIVEQIANLFFAGTDTTSHYVMAMIYYLAAYPQVLDEVRKEVNSVIKTEQDITYENLKNLNYMECVQKQTTRHFGPANILFPRVVKADMKLGNLPLVKGTIINANVLCNHFNPKFFEDPLQFKPERWANPEIYKNINPFAYLGFSAGPRSCLGKQFAQMQSKIALVLWIKRFNWKLEQEMRFQYAFLNAPVPQKLTLEKCK